MKHKEYYYYWCPSDTAVQFLYSGPSNWEPLLCSSCCLTVGCGTCMWLSVTCMCVRVSGPLAVTARSGYSSGENLLTNFCQQVTINTYFQYISNNLCVQPCSVTIATKVWSITCGTREKGKERGWHLATTILYNYHHSTKLYRKISRVCCRLYCYECAARVTMPKN